VRTAKEMMGLNSEGKIVKMNYDLEFVLIYRPYKKDNKLKIKQISAIGVQCPRESSGLNVGLNLAPGFSTVNTKEFTNEINSVYGSWDQSGGFSLFMGAEANYYLEDERFGFGARLNYTRYKSSFSLDSVAQQGQMSLTDIDGDEYLIRVKGDSLTESVKLNWISIPVFFKYRYVFHDNKKLGHVFVNIGPEFSFSVKKSVSTSGVYSYKGYYPDYHVVLEDIGYYGYVFDKPLESEPKSNIKSVNISLMAEVGMNMPLTDKFNVNLSLLFQKGLLNLSDKNDSYIISRGLDDISPLMDSRNSVSTLFFGINIGIMYKLY
jgi:hypothetical protein